MLGRRQRGAEQARSEHQTADDLAHHSRVAPPREEPAGRMRGGKQQRRRKNEVSGGRGSDVHRVTEQPVG